MRWQPEYPQAAPLRVGMRTRVVFVLTGFGLVPTFINIRGDSSRVSSRVPRQLVHGSQCQSAGQHRFTPDPISRGHERHLLQGTFALTSSWLFDLWGWRAPGRAAKDGTGPFTLCCPHFLGAFPSYIPYSHPSYSLISSALRHQ